MKKKSYKESNVSTGQVEKPTPTTLDQLFGFDKGNIGTLNYDEYTDKLDKMALFELQDEARKVGCPPIDDKNRLKRTLKNEFRIYASNYFVPQQPKPQEPKNVSKIVTDFMAEGR